MTKKGQKQINYVQELQLDFHFSFMQFPDGTFKFKYGTDERPSTEKYIEQMFKGESWAGKDEAAEFKKMFKLTNSKWERMSVAKKLYKIIEFWGVYDVFYKAPMPKYF